MPAIESADFWGHLRAWFLDYAASYKNGSRRDREMIQLKEDHSLRVSREMEDLARDLKTPAAEAALAKIIGLLHDVGRFEQYRRYRTFNDRESVDHGVLSVQCIRDHALLARVAPEKVAVIEASIQYHNRIQLPPGLTGQTLFFAKLLRDADKLDIFKVVLQRQDLGIGGGFVTDAGGTLLPDVCESVHQSLMAGRMVALEDVQSITDALLMRVGWIYDVNFVPTLKKIQRRGYIVQLNERLPQTRRIDAIFQRLQDRGLIETSV